jgi:oxygen-independent coproporphyrinogen-3 oxidase
MFLGLRKVEGVNRTHFKEKFGCSLEEVYGQVLSKHFSNGSMISTDDSVAISKQGRFIGNEIFQTFLEK